MLLYLGVGLDVIQNIFDVHETNEHQETVESLPEGEAQLSLSRFMCRKMIDVLERINLYV